MASAFNFDGTAGLKKFYVAAAIALVVSVTAVLTLTPAVPENVRIKDQAAAALPGFGRAIRQSPPAVAAVLLHYAHADNKLPLYLAEASLLKYPAMARKILPVYGERPAFIAILRRYGTSIFPPIDYFMTHRVRSVDAMVYTAGKMRAARAGFDDATATLGRLLGLGPAGDDGTQAGARPDHDLGHTRGGEAFDGGRRGRPTRRKPSAATGSGNAGRDEGRHRQVTPVLRGWFAVRFIDREGHDFLGQFTIAKDGQVVWLQSKRVLQDLNTFFAGGISTLDKRYQTGQGITVNDAGWAAADVIGAATGLKLLSAGKWAATGARTGRSFGDAGRSAGAVEKTGRSARAAEQAPGAPHAAENAVTPRHATLGAGLATAGRAAGGGLRGARYAKWPVIVGTAYLVVKHPSVISGMLSRAAHVLGLPGRLVQFVGWFIILLSLLYAGSWILKYLVGPAIFALRMVIKSFLKIERMLE